MTTADEAYREQARRELERRRAAATPSPPRQTVPFPEFEGDQQRRARIELDARDAAKERAGAAYRDPAKTQQERSTEELADYERLLAEERSKRVEALEFITRIDGRARPTAPPYVAPPFRATRIRQEPIYQAPLAEPVGFRRLYDDGQALLPPTPGQELQEAFAQQVVLTEDQARRRAEEIAAQRQAITEAQAAGRPVPEFEEPEAAVAGVLSRPSGTGAIVETPLAATLRAVPGVAENLLAEVQFGLLGYDVDPTTGQAIDPEDFGLKVAQVRERLGLPETASSTDILRGISVVPRTIGAGVEAVTGLPVTAAIEQGLEALPAAIRPLPGIATTREEQTPTTGVLRTAPSRTDPEERRVASEADDLELRLARNVTVGRGYGDEFRSVPALRDEYARIYGDEDAAWWAGTLASLAIPTGPGTAARMSRGLGRSLARYAPILSPTQNFIRFADSVDVGAINYAADLAAVVSDTPQADARILRNVAQQVIRNQTTTLGEAGVQAAVDAVKASEAATVDDLARVASRALGEDPDVPVGALRDSAPGYLRIHEELVRNSPGDMVMVTDSVAAPSSVAPAIRKAAAAEVGTVINRDATGISQELRRLQRAVTESDAKLAADLERVADDLAAQIAADGLQAATETARGPGVRSIVERAAQAMGNDPRTAGRLYGRSTPDEVARKWSPLGGGSTPVSRLAGVQTWDELDAQTIRTALEEIRSLAALRAGRGAATATRRLSDLQSYVSRANNPKLLDGRIGRRLRAVVSKEGRPSLSIEKARENIRSAASQAFRTAGETLDQAAREYGTVEKALDALVGMSPERPDAVWQRVLGHVYGELTEKTRAAVGAILEGSDEYPTVQALVDVDRRLIASGDIAGRQGLAARVATSQGRANWERAMFREYLEEMVRKGVAKTSREAEGLAQAILRNEEDADILRSHGLPSGLPKAPRPEDYQGVVRQYDTAASRLEQKIAENGEEFAALLDVVPVRQRGSWSQLVKDLANDGSAWARNAVYGLRYGYAVPNLPLHLGRLVEAPVLSIATIGVSKTAAALGQLGRRLDPRQWANRKYGGILTTPEGVTYTPQQVEQMMDVYGLGATRLEAERVGSLANDLLVSARKAASEKGLTDRFQVALDAANPATRSMGARMAEAIELTFRRGVFESALAGGEPPSEAAALARQSQLSYSEVPDIVQQYAGQMFATASNYYMLVGEMVNQVAENPSAVRAIIKSQQKRAQAADPYGLTGDETLRATFRFEEDGRAFYGPANPLLMPVGGTLALLGGLNHIVANLGQAAKLGVGGGGQYLEDGIGRTAEATTEMVVDKTLDIARILGAVDDEEEYDPGKVTLEELTDEQMFHAMLMTAELLDTDRELGLYEAMNTILDPVTVKPPEGQALEYFNEDQELVDHPELWAVQPPEGTPFVRVYLGENVPGDGTAFRVVRPSKKGLTSLRMMRAATPAMAERMVALGAGLSESDRMDLEAVLPGGVAAMAGAFLPVSMGTADPQALEAKAAESLAEGMGRE